MPLIQLQHLMKMTLEGRIYTVTNLIYICQLVGVILGTRGSRRLSPIHLDNVTRLTDQYSNVWATKLDNNWYFNKKI